VVAPVQSLMVWYLHAKNRNLTVPSTVSTQGVVLRAVGDLAPGEAALPQYQSLPLTMPLPLWPDSRVQNVRQVMPGQQQPRAQQHLHLPTPSVSGEVPHSVLPARASSVVVATSEVGVRHTPRAPSPMAGQFGTFTAAATGTMKSRRPYRFCTRCWIKTSRWVMKHIVLPDGAVCHKGSHTSRTCPQWTQTVDPPTDEQNRAHAAAFKSAQRRGELHRLAVQIFKDHFHETQQSSDVSIISDEDLVQYLQA